MAVIYVNQHYRNKITYSPYGRCGCFFYSDKYSISYIRKLENTSTVNYCTPKTRVVIHAYSTLSEQSIWAINADVSSVSFSEHQFNFMFWTQIQPGKDDKNDKTVH